MLEIPVKITLFEGIKKAGKMMTQEVYECITKDDDSELRKLMGVDKVYYNPEMWDGNKIWPKVSRRMTALQLAVREGKDFRG